MFLFLAHPFLILLNSFYEFLAFLNRVWHENFIHFQVLFYMESALPFVVLLKGVVVRVEGLKMSPSGRLVDYAALNDGTRGMVPQDQLVVHRENMTKEHLLCMSGYVCLGDNEEIIVFINILLCQKYGSFCGKLTV